MDTKQLREFYNALDDNPVKPDSPYYVPYLKNQSSTDPVTELATAIDWSEAASVNLFSGQRGSGKSTELLRLKKELEDKGCIVFLSDATKYMNMTTPVEITDFFISIMSALNDEVSKRYYSETFKGYWERLKNLLQTDVRIEEINLSGGFIEMKASLKEDPTFRQNLQMGLKGHVAKIVRQSHEFASEMVELVRTKEGDKNKKVVLIIDSVEQIRGVGSDATNIYASVENLFSAHAESLRFPLLHVIYTIPPYLTALAPSLGARFGGTLFNLPSVHIFNYKSSEPNKEGIKTMETIIEKRFSKWREIFTSAQLEAMAIATGGDIRDFFRLIRGSLNKISSKTKIQLPADDNIIEETKNHMRMEKQPIAGNDMIWLKDINKSKAHELKDINLLQTLARFFDAKLVLNYRNGEDWYDVHPLLHEIIKNYKVPNS